MNNQQLYTKLWECHLQHADMAKSKCAFVFNKLPGKKFFFYFLLSILTLLLSADSKAQLRADFSANLVSGCAPILVQFTDHSAGNPTEWKWDLGNGTISNLANPSVTYFTSGVYTVKLVVKSGNNRDSIIRTNYILVNSTPVINFHADVTTGCAPLAVNFIDESVSSTSAINSWQWDFGDGMMSTTAQPSHVYNTAGNYNVTLKAINTAGCITTVRKTGYIKNNSIDVAASNDIFSNCTPNKIVFQNTITASAGSILSNEWDFGDGTGSVLANPTHTYAAAGNYVVKLVAKSQFGCRDSVVQNLQVYVPVSAAFTADHITNCRPPVNVHFTNQAQNTSTYLWDFGDGITATTANPEHLYEDTGMYTVKLIVRNSNGCVDSLQKGNYIKINKPFLTIAGLPDSSCQPFTKALSAYNFSNSAVSSCTWSFGDGGASNLMEPTHTYSNLGYYDVRLVATDADGCRDTVFVPYGVRITGKPTAGFRADIRSGCAKTPISFTNLSSSNTTSYTWFFGDESISDEQNPVHQYADTGWMTVTLVARNGGCTDTITYHNYIYIQPSVAKFTIGMDCANPYVRTFNNFSIGSDRFSWDFGDGTTSTEFSPVHTYRTMGDFVVTLSVWNNGTGCDNYLSKGVTILKVTPSFTASDTVICKGGVIRFTAGVNAADVVRYYWDFGEDSVIASRLRTISHTFKNSGTYTIKLYTVSTLSCVDTIVKSMYIKVNGPKANFGLSANVACANHTVGFFDSSSASSGSSIVKWIWKYGDGVIDTLTAPGSTHMYLNQGVYRPTLKLVDSKGCTDTYVSTRILKTVKVNAQFFVYDSVACLNSAVKIVCPYATPGLTYHWNLGDGALATVQSPSHAYTAEGLYTIKLNLKDIYGCEDSSQQVNAVKVAETVAAFNMSDSFRTCPPLLVQFTNNSLNAIAEHWDFGDSSYSDSHNPSHFYVYPGVYTVTLYAKGPGGCVKTMHRQIVVKGPLGNFSYSPLTLCSPYNVRFQVHSVNAVSYTWDFNDGHTLSTSDSIVNHTYLDSGKFIPKIILINEYGCRVPITGRDTLNNLFVKSAFTFSDSMQCSHANVAFHNTSSSNDNQLFYKWNFGDGTTSTEKNPVHQYLASGMYYPSLAVTTRFGCVDSFISSQPVTVVLLPDLHITATASGCSPLTASFSTGLPASATTFQWHWIMGNGNTSDLQNPPSQLYSLPGNYTVSVMATSANGCTATAQHTLQVFASPSIQVAGDTVMCSGKPTLLNLSGAANYKWVPGAGLSCDTCASVMATPAAGIQYQITGTSLQGCTSTRTLNVNVKQPLVMSYSQSVNICAGSKERLQASGATTYQWSPAAGLSSTVTALPWAQPDTTTTYRVIGSDDLGCFKDTGYVKVIVNKIPTVNAGRDITINAGRALDLTADVSSDVTEVRWSPTGDIFRIGTNDITVKPSKNTEYTVEVKNAGGCTAKDKITVFVICNGTNVFIPTLFSPNNDGVNDIFYPRGTGLFQVRSLRIYNRWGETVFEKKNFNSNDPSAGWDGNYKGSKLDTDVYVYTIELLCDNNNVLAMNGNISLMR